VDVTQLQEQLASVTQQLTNLQIASSQSNMELGKDNIKMKDAVG